MGRCAVKCPGTWQSQSGLDAGASFDVLICRLDTITRHSIITLLARSFMALDFGLVLHAGSSASRRVTDALSLRLHTSHSVRLQLH